MMDGSGTSGGTAGMRIARGSTDLNRPNGVQRNCLLNYPAISAHPNTQPQNPVTNKHNNKRNQKRKNKKRHYQPHTTSPVSCKKIWLCSQNMLVAHLVSHCRVKMII
jgi:hypothetical protein